MLLVPIPESWENALNLVGGIQEIDIDELVGIQRSLLNKAVDRLTPGGGLVYSTCSIEKEENQKNMEWFVKEHPEFTLISDQLFLPGNPADGGYQAFLRHAD